MKQYCLKSTFRWFRRLYLNSVARFQGPDDQQSLSFAGWWLYDEDLSLSQNNGYCKDWNHNSATVWLQSFTILYNFTLKKNGKISLYLRDFYPFHFKQCSLRSPESSWPGEFRKKSMTTKTERLIMMSTMLRDWNFASLQTNSLKTSLGPW